MNRQCPKCGSVVVDGLNFCPSCGAPVEAPVESVNPTVVETPVVDPAVNAMPTMESVVPSVEIPVAPVVPEVVAPPSKAVFPPEVFHIDPGGRRRGFSAFPNPGRWYGGQGGS